MAECNQPMHKPRFKVAFSSEPQIDAVNEMKDDPEYCENAHNLADSP